MPTITVKNIPDALYEHLRESAAAHRRSINSELIVRLELSLGTTPLAPDELLARADALRNRLALPPLTERRLRAIKTAGRR